MAWTVWDMSFWFIRSCSNSNNNTSIYPVYPIPSQKSVRFFQPHLTHVMMFPCCWLWCNSSRRCLEASQEPCRDGEQKNAAGIQVGTSMVKLGASHGEVCFGTVWCFHLFQRHMTTSGDDEAGSKAQWNLPTMLGVHGNYNSSRIMWIPDVWGRRAS